MTKEKIIMGWSAGKDSAMALFELLRSDQYEVAALLTTCTEGFRRISMHGVRCSLLKMQADALGIPLRKVFIPQQCTNADYEHRMEEVCLEFKRQGITKVAFGDLFLEEIRAYRDRMLACVGMTAIYPLWGRNTKMLAEQFVQAGFRAVLVCVDPNALASGFAGRTFDASLLRDLPANVDPCGEKGEFHTFVFDGPIFRQSIRCRPGRVVQRDHFYFADLLPLSARQRSCPESAGSERNARPRHRAPEDAIEPASLPHAVAVLSDTAALLRTIHSRQRVKNKQTKQNKKSL